MVQATVEEQNELQFAQQVEDLVAERSSDLTDEEYKEEVLRPEQ